VKIGAENFVRLFVLVPKQVFTLRHKFRDDQKKKSRSKIKEKEEKEKK